MSTTTYKVTIEKIEADIPCENEGYHVVGKKENGEDKYAYVTFDSTETKISTIYTQTVRDIDLKLVIDAVNNPDTCDGCSTLHKQLGQV